MLQLSDSQSVVPGSAEQHPVKWDMHTLGSHAELLHQKHWGRPQQSAFNQLIYWSDACWSLKTTALMPQAHLCGRQPLCLVCYPRSSSSLISQMSAGILAPHRDFARPPISNDLPEPPHPSLCHYLFNFSIKLPEIARLLLFYYLPH